MGWTNFRDRLAQLVIISIVGLIVADKWLEVAADWRGALIVILTLVGQFYFRKKESEDEGVK